MTIDKETLSHNVEQISKMTVDEFQITCEDYNIAAWEIDHMVYDLAKALTVTRSKSNGRKI